MLQKKKNKKRNCCTIFTLMDSLGKLDFQYKTEVTRGQMESILFPL